MNIFKGQENTAVNYLPFVNIRMNNCEVPSSVSIEQQKYL